LPWEDALDPNAGPSSSRLTSHELGTTTAAQGYWEYLPGGYPSAGAQWPLLVALHGIGENGNGTTDLPKVLNVGITKLINQDMWPGDRPFVVLMPQHVGGGCPNANEIQAFIDYGITNYDIDPRFVYLTGLSCGAIGAWNYLGQHLDSQIAAMVPIAGLGGSAWNAAGCDLGKVAIWAFHGDEDPTVSVDGTNVPMDGLAGCPSPPALENIKTIYPDVFHNSWDMTYNLSAGHDIYTWMLGFSKPMPRVGR
jgi:predicted peptidase